MFVFVNSSARLLIWFGGWNGSVTSYDIDRQNNLCRVREFALFWPVRSLRLPLNEIEGSRIERHRDRLGLSRYEHTLLLDRGRRLNTCCFGKRQARKLVRLIAAFLKAE